MSGTKEKSTKKRKVDDLPEIEIDVSATEPPSKKALRKAKKKVVASPKEPAIQTSTKPQSETTNGLDTDNKNGRPSSTAVVQQNISTETEKRSEYGVWVGNLAFTTTKEELRKFFTSGTSIPESRITRVHQIGRASCRERVSPRV